MTETVALSDPSGVKYTLAAASAVVMIGIGFGIAGFTAGSDASTGDPDASRRAGTSQSLAVDPAVDPAADPAADPGTGTDLVDPAAGPDPSAVPSQTPTSPSAAAKPAPTRKPVEKPRTTKPRTTAPTTKPAPPASGSVVQQVLAHINAARAKSGLPAYALSANLSKAATLHTQLMINGCGMEHRCPGEADLGPRFTAQGVTWSAAGENIGYGSADNTEAEIIRAANGLTDSMLAEKPPNDGHRRNLLSKDYRHIGLSIIRDGDRRVWMTQDFVN